MIAVFSTLLWSGHDAVGLLFVAKAETYTVNGGVPDLLKNEDVTVRYSAEKWDALQLTIVEENERVVIVGEKTGPRFAFPRKIFEQLCTDFN